MNFVFLFSLALRDVCFFIFLKIMWKHSKEMFAIDKQKFTDIIKFWKTYKILYIIMMIIIFSIALFVSRFYKNERGTITGVFHQVFRIYK